MKPFRARLGIVLRRFFWVLLWSGALPAATVAHELQLQGSTSAGGSNTVVCGRVNGDLPFSVTGRFNDVLVVFDNTGWPVFVEDVRGLATKSYLRTRPVEQLASGETRVFLKAVTAGVILNGGRMEIWRAGITTPLDRDQIVLVP